jgi:hypothetical protein
MTIVIGFSPPRPISNLAEQLQLVNLGLREKQIRHGNRFAHTGLSRDLRRFD